MVSVYQKRVWACMANLRVVAPHLNFDATDELLSKECVAMCALQDMEALVVYIKCLNEYRNLPWWKRVLGWGVR